MFKIRKIGPLFKNFLSLSDKDIRRDLRVVIAVSAICFSFLSKSQAIGNYVNNGSFEDYTPGDPYPAHYWTSLSPPKFFGVHLAYPNKVPYASYGYQWSYHGKCHFISSQYSTFGSNNRGYPRNILKGTLNSGTVYCVTMHINLSDQSTHGIDAIGAYFGDSTLDTIKKCTDPITYLIPQIQNPVNNIITDTTNWVSVTGTFVANGTEKYMVIGNFNTDANTNTLLTNTTNLPANATNYLIDAVSVIEFDLPAYAGPDVSTAPGHSVYIGRELDFAIDPGCVWFKLPEMTPIDTASGTWVQPIVTTTYVVRQILDCGSEKWDTVVVHMDLVGLERIKQLKEHLQIYPVPARDYIELSCSDKALLREIETAAIYNNLGQKLREEKFAEERFRIKIEDLPPGSYSLYIKNYNDVGFNKRFVIAP